MTIDLVDVSAYGIEFDAAFVKNTFHFERKSVSASTLIGGTIDGTEMTGLFHGLGIESPFTGIRTDMEGALVRGENRDHTLVVYPTADHGLRLVREKGAAWDFPRTVLGAHTSIADWLREHVHVTSQVGSGGVEWMP